MNRPYDPGSPSPEEGTPLSRQLVDELIGALTAEPGRAESYQQKVLGGLALELPDDSHYYL